MRIIPTLSTADTARVLDPSSPVCPHHLGVVRCADAGAVGEAGLGGTSYGYVACGRHLLGLPTGLRAWLAAFRGYHPGRVGLPGDPEVLVGRSGLWSCSDERRDCWRWQDGDTDVRAALMAATGLTEDQVRSW